MISFLGMLSGSIAASTAGAAWIAGMGVGERISVPEHAARATM